LAEVAKKQGLDVKIFPCQGRFDRETVGMIKDQIAKQGVQILHSHNYKSNFYAWRGIENSNNGVQWVVTNHGRRSGAKLLFYTFLDGFIVRRADKVIAVSEEIRKRMKRAGIAEEKICLIDNGVNLDRFPSSADPNTIKESLGIDREAQVIGTVGALTLEKGHVYLLRAAAKVIKTFPRAVFLLVGDGKERLNLATSVSQLGIQDNVIFTGMRKDVPEILPILDVFLLPSLNEGLPMALLEAQAARVPTVSTRVGGIPAVVEDGTTGILIPPKDSDAIVQAISRMLLDRKTALEMGQKGCERVRDHFSSQTMASKYISIYKELLTPVQIR
jgi:glycosyltransferase involved in cell wall biosynthesis